MIDDEILYRKDLSIDWKCKNRPNLNDRYRSSTLELSDSCELREITRVIHWITSIRTQSYKIKQEIRRIEAGTRFNFSRIHLEPNSDTDWYLGTIAPAIHHPDVQSGSTDQPLYQGDTNGGGRSPIRPSEHQDCLHSTYLKAWERGDRERDCCNTNLKKSHESWCIYKGFGLLNVRKLKCKSIWAFDPFNTNLN
jgi:hypothetical protein